MKKLQLTAALTLAFITVVPCGSHGALVVVPGAQGSAEGNTALDRPFSTGVNSMRYQQGYAASHFSSLTGPSWITQIAFRPDFQFGNAFSSVLPDLQINLSTMPSGSNPNMLNTTFASNVGADDTVVFARGALSLSSSPGTLVPENFDLVITLTTPFLYDPSNGGLLLDVRNYGGGLTTLFDAQFHTADGIGAVFRSSNGIPGPGLGVDAPTGLLDHTGLVTRFTFQPVPELSTFFAGTLLLLPFAASTLRVLRRK